MRVRDERGVELDASFFVEREEGKLTLLFESRSGTLGSARARNADYNPGLETILARLREIGAVLDDIVVDSERLRFLAVDEVCERAEVVVNDARD